MSNQSSSMDNNKIPLKKQESKKRKFSEFFDSDAFTMLTNLEINETPDKHLVKFNILDSKKSNSKKIKRVCFEIEKPNTEHMFIIEGKDVFISKYVINKLSTLGKIKNKSIVESLEICYENSKEYPFTYAEKFYNQFIGLKKLVIEGVDNMVKFMCIIKDIPNLETIEFRKCFLGDIDFSIILNKKIKNLYLNECSGLTERRILNSLSDSIAPICRFEKNIGLRDEFCNKFQDLKTQINQKVSEYLNKECIKNEIQPSELSYEIRKTLYMLVKQNIVCKCKFDKNDHFISIE
jgi:hypothetical protein